MSRNPSPAPPPAAQNSQPREQREDTERWPGHPERQTEDDMQREQLGPRGVPGAPDPARMTPQRRKKTPDDADPPHTA